MLDVDTGVDDALAVLLAAGHPGVELRGVICTAGNASLDRVVANTRYVLSVAGCPDVPVVMGAASTLDGRGPRPASPHGPDGLAGLGPPATAAAARGGPTVDDLLRARLDGAVLVLLAPQSSVAGAVRADPAVLRGAVRIVAAAGSASGSPEFNADHDPSARREVRAAAAASGVHVVDVPVELGRRVLTDPGPLAATDLGRALLAARGGAPGDAAVLAHAVGVALD